MTKKDKKNLFLYGFLGSLIVLFLFSFAKELYSKLN